MLSRISKNKNNTVKHKVSLARPPEVETPEVETPEIVTPKGEKPEGETPTSDYITELKNIHKNITDHYHTNFTAKKLGLSNTTCNNFMVAFTKMEKDYDVVKQKVLVRDDVTEENKNSIREWDSSIVEMRTDVLKYCKNTTAKDNDIESKLRDIDKLILPVEKISKDNYGRGYGRMSAAHCKAMMDCQPLIDHIKKELDDIESSVTSNGSVPYRKQLKGLRDRCTTLQTKVNHAKTEKCKSVVKSDL